MPKVQKPIPMVQIDPQAVAMYMVRNNGIEPENIKNDILDGLTEALAEALNDIYSLEAKVVTEIKRKVA